MCSCTFGALVEGGKFRRLLCPHLGPSSAIILVVSHLCFHSYSVKNILSFPYNSSLAHGLFGCTKGHKLVLTSNNCCEEVSEQS